MKQDRWDFRSQMLRASAYILLVCATSAAGRAEASCPCFDAKQIVTDCHLNPDIGKDISQWGSINHRTWDPEEVSYLTCSMKVGEDGFDHLYVYAGHWTTNDIGSPKYCRMDRGNNKRIALTKPLSSDQLGACRAEIDKAAAQLR